MSEETFGLIQRRRRRSRVEAEQLVREFESSGLTRQAFCAERGLSVASLDKYRRGLLSSAGPLVAVEVVSGIRTDTQTIAEVDGALLVELRNGRRVAVRRGFDATTLQRLVTALEQV